MPDLNLGPPPSRSPWPAALIAIAGLGAAAAAIFLLNPHKTAELSVTSTQIFAPRIVTKGDAGTMHVIGTVPHVDEALYIAVRVKIEDKLRLPLFISSETAVLTAPDGSVLESTAIPASGLDNLYTTFPELKKIASDPLPRDARVEPGGTTEGMVLLHFPGANQSNWTNRKSATLTLGLAHQSPQTVVIP